MPARPIGLFSALRCTLVYALLLGAAAHAQDGSRLAPEQVLVVYDSRVADSLAVAEFYAGSGVVQGGAGGEPGVRPGVRAFDLATTGIPVLPTSGNIGFTRFRTDIRAPIRAHLVAQGLELNIRCVVLTKGIPHRVQDNNNGNIGDPPSEFLLQWSGRRNATAASVDSELALLWQDLEAGEAGRSADSFADGWVINPYWQQPAPHNTFSNADALVQKELAPVFPMSGRIWSLGVGAPETVLTPGDMLLVSRLDGHTVADVRASVLRAQSIVYDVDEAVFVFDESNANGVADAAENSELDNQGDALSNSGDDYERSRDLLLSDGRFDPAHVAYNSANGPSGFLVGPLLDFGGEGVLIDGPVLLLAHYGQNHAGGKPNDGPVGSAAPIYAESFRYADGAIFNTVESYNTRALGTLGTLFNQEQAADFIGAGGTFALGHCWEPFALTIPDNEFIVRNFVLGDLTWAEAAWSSIPTLSWMHVVLGDPLATACRTSEDRNADGVLDFFDVLDYLGAFDAQDPSADLDRNSVYDFFDVLAFLGAFDEGC